ncbi:MAG: hypothetical protein WAL63_19375 [Solirubrobacteraceae bacterium]
MIDGRGRRRIAGAAAALGTAALLLGAAALLLGAPAARRSHGTYGAIPSWIPKSNVTVGRIVTATPAHPWLAIEGDTVRVELAAGATMMTSVGPQVPEEGQFPVPQTTPCRFVVTFAAVHGSIPLSRRAFSFLSEHGHGTAARVALRGGGRLPSRITSGAPVTLSVSARLPTGNGELRWAPDGTAPVASWDFDVEID